MAEAELVGAEELSAEFSRRLVARSTALDPGPLPRRLGIEQEYVVVRDGRAVDFRTIAPRLDALGLALHPTDPGVRLTPEGIALLADGDVAEAASPPVALRAGCVTELDAWGATGARLLASVLDAGDALDGGSTHLSVEVDPALNDELCLAYATTYAPGLMLLLDRRDSPGLLVRPRPGRAELCGEHAAGPILRAATAYAIGSVAAAAADLAAGRWSGPPQLDATIEPGRRRYGWYVSRQAFGPDLYATGRAAVLRTASGSTITAQEALERGWAAARAVLAPLVAADDLADADAAAAGERPLPSETDERPGFDPATASAPRATPLGRATSRRARDGFTIELHTATWEFAGFTVTAPSGRVGLAVVPQHLLAAFLALLDGGELDDLLPRWLATPRGDRVVERAVDTAEAGLHDDLVRSEALLPEDRVGVGPGAVDPRRPGKLVPDATRVRRRPPRAVGARRRRAVAVASLVVAGIAAAVLTSVAGDEERAPGALRPTTTLPLGAPTDPTVGTAPPPTPGTAVPVTDPTGQEDPVAFLAAFAEAFREGDEAFLLDRMHPAVIARYGLDACEAQAARFGPDPDLRMDFIDARPEPFEYATDGLSLLIPDAIAIEVFVIDADGPRDDVFHFALADGRHRYFTECGLPLPGAT